MSNFDTTIIPVDISEIHVGVHVKNIRTVFDEAGISELAKGIQRDGLMNPLTVMMAEDADNNQITELVAGERRLRAIQFIRSNLDPNFLDEGVPCIVYTGGVHDAEFANALENLDRENVDAVDTSSWLHRRVSEGVTQGELAEKLNRSAPWIGARVTFFERACDELKQALREGIISESAAFELAKNLDKAEQKKRIEKARKFGEKISVEDAKRANDPNQSSKPSKKERERQLAEAQKTAADNAVARGVAAGLKWCDGLLTTEELQETISFEATVKP